MYMIAKKIFVVVYEVDLLEWDHCNPIKLKNPQRYLKSG